MVPPRFPSRPLQSVAELFEKVRHQCLDGPAGRETFNFAQVVRETGYQKTQLLRAQAALDQHWARERPQRSFVITADQLLDMLVWLSHDYWSKALHVYRCLWCGEYKKRHKGQGLCLRCYRKYVRRCRALGLPHQVRALSGFKRFLDRKPGRIPQEIQRRISRGWALSEEHLTWLSKQDLRR